MRRKYESGREPPQLRYAWIVALACFAMTGFVPTTALAQPVPGETGVDDADEAAEAPAAEEPAAEEVAAEEVNSRGDRGDAAAGRGDDRGGGPRGRRGSGGGSGVDRRGAGTARTRRDANSKPGSRMTWSHPKEPVGPGLLAPEGRAKKIQVSLNEDGSLYLRFAMWLQVWTRAIQHNPGTTVLGNDDQAWYGDVGLRRARFLMFGKIAPRTFMLMHIGINNQTFRRDGGGFKQQVFFHDAWVEFEASKKGHFTIGAGLLYWNGISRMTNASTITFMSLDSPIFTWPTIELSDQFARQLGALCQGVSSGSSTIASRLFGRFARAPYDPMAPPTPPRERDRKLQPHRQHLWILGLLPVSVPGYRVQCASVHGGHLYWCQEGLQLGLWWPCAAARHLVRRGRHGSCRRETASSLDRFDGLVPRHLRSRVNTAERPPGTARTTTRTSDRTTSETSAS